MRMHIVGQVVELLGRALRRLGPYALIEIVLPGGTLLVLLLYACRRWRLRRYSVVAGGDERVPPVLSTTRRLRAEASSPEAAMTAFAGCAGTASSASSAASRMIGANRCPA